MSKSYDSNDQQRHSRREALQRGAVGTAGVIAAGALNSRVMAEEPAKAPEKTPEQIAADTKTTRDAAARTKAAGKKTKAKSIIQIFLWGGMSHNDSWDPKPESGYDYLGELNKFIPRTLTEFNSVRCSLNWPNRLTSTP